MSSPSSPLLSCRDRIVSSSAARSQPTDLSRCEPLLGTGSSVDRDCVVAFEPGRLGESDQRFGRCRVVALGVQSPGGVLREDQRIGAQAADQECLGAREQRDGCVVAQFDEPRRDLVEQLQGPGDVPERGERAAKVVASLQRRELLSDRAIQHLSFRQIRDRQCRLAAAHPNSAPVGHRAGKKERVLLASKPGNGTSEELQRLINPARAAAQRRTLQLCHASQLPRPETVDFVEVAEGRRPAPGDRQDSGEGEVGICGEFVGADLVRGSDGLVERMFGEVDLTEHAQRTSQHSEGAAELSPIVLGSRLGRDLARLTGYLCRIIPDRRGQFGQEVHVAMVRPTCRRRFTRIFVTTNTIR